MEYRPLEITVIAAKDIKDVNIFGKMDVYLVANLSGDNLTKQKTPIDKDGGTNPKWNFQMKFNIDEDAALKGGLVLIFQLRCDRSIGSDKDIGVVHVPVKELLDNANAGDEKSAQFVSYQVRTSSGKPKGQLNFSYKFGDKITVPAPTVSKGDEPVTAYPASSGTSSGGYPPPGASGYPPYGASGYPPQGASGYPPPSQNAYPYPPQPVAGYGYPPQGVYQNPPPPPGYGYPPAPGYGYPPMQQQQQQQPKKNKFGMGLGAGLLGGALGGLLIGDMVSDAAYDGGYDDAGGFDF
ncbi:protein SRC2-like [Telopea speciosissima]|uniref:protein SRC2-like n=1 Tax=Telopea speciosissima TaxID=54955 RepID=UPI001CC5C846|nr:protein SRC2-like [Telopea speciosissima]